MSDRLKEIEAKLAEESWYAKGPTSWDIRYLLDEVKRLSPIFADAKKKIRHWQHYSKRVTSESNGEMETP